MINNLHAVPIGEIVVSDATEDVLVAYGLGSCVAICLYDPVAQIGGMLHALLPASPGNSRRNKRAIDASKSLAKFVDQGTPLLLDSLLKRGARRSRLTAQLCGGAQVLNAPGFEKGNTLNIGERNIRAAESALKTIGISIKAQDTGGNIGRTVKLYISDGQVTVKSLGQGERVLGN